MTQIERLTAEFRELDRVTPRPLDHEDYAICAIQFFKGQDQKVIQVLYAESWYELADISYEFGVTWMHIYDEPPSRHIDRVKWASITNIRIKPITE